MTTKREQLVTLSLLDRLWENPQGLREGGRDGWPETRQESIRAYRKCIKRDVEYLLNTRCPPIEDISLYPKAAASVMNFGLPDLTSFSESYNDQNALLAAMLQTLRRFEPRIQNPRVLVTRPDQLSRSVRFHVEGNIKYDNMVEKIEFDTVLELARGEYEVK